MVSLKYEAGLESLVRHAESLAHEGPEWLCDVRLRALRTHVEHGVPTTKVEDWKYTPLRDFASTPWEPAEPGPAVFEQGPSRFEDDSLRIVLVNGRFDRNLSGSLSGVTAVSLRDALIEHTTVVRSNLGHAGPETTRTVDREIKPDVFTFGELNTAAFEDGLFLHVPEGTEVGPLVEIVHVLTGGSRGLALPRLLIVVGEGASVRLVETYLTDGEVRGATVPVTEVFVGRHARVEHVRVQDQSMSSTHIGLWQVRQEEDSDYRSTNVCYGGGLARVDQGVWLGGERTLTRLDGVVCGAGDQHIDNHTRLDHAKANSNSFEIYKQVVDDRATVVFNGKIFVHQDAQKTDAKQTNQALLLSPQATIDSKPQLEIFADDVKCTHGATVGQLEDLPMFYMRSRGVPRDQAEAVLVYAFAAEVLELVTIESVRTDLERRLYQKLGVDLT